MPHRRRRRRRSSSGPPTEQTVRTDAPAYSDNVFVLDDDGGNRGV